MEAICEVIPRRMDEYDNLLTGQPILQRRLQGVGALDAATAVDLGVTGPLLRAAGVAWDTRRDFPYLAYDDVDFDVIVGTQGDCWDRFAVRITRSASRSRSAPRSSTGCPRATTASRTKRSRPPRGRIDESMEALIHHFKLYTEGFKVPSGEAYVPIESPRGELGCYVVSDGSSRPYRPLHMRTPSFANLQAFPVMAKGGFLADAIVLVSTIDPVLGDVDR